jgi:ubiquinone/menaquinone biosynthesis C-methylase UbiE
LKTRDYWSTYQPGFRFARSSVGTKAFFDEVDQYRYSLEPHIPDVVRFDRWSGRSVLEAGCGIGTDGARLAGAGARYTGLDSSMKALSLARHRFALDELTGTFVAGSVTCLPFPDQTFDLVFSHGIIHHVQDTEAAVREFHRVLKPGGTVLVMVYHRNSFNYFVTLMLIRRLLVGLLLIPGAAKVVAKVTGEPQDVIDGHRRLLSEHGLQYIRDKDLFLANNTDGPGNPLSKVYSRDQLQAMFHPGFGDAQTDARYLNLRLYPGGLRLSNSRVGRRLERRAGWHLYIEGTKDGASTPRSVT